MTEEDRLLLVDLKANTEQLFQKYVNIENENKRLEETIVNLQNVISKLEQEKSEMVKKNEKLKLATHILSGVDENKEAKRKINILVREIDKCIALLNK